METAIGQAELKCRGRWKNCRFERNGIQKDWK